jgi:hypothetical protein
MGEVRLIGQWGFSSFLQVQFFRFHKGLGHSLLQVVSFFQVQQHLGGVLGS